MRKYIILGILMGSSLFASNDSILESDLVAQERQDVAEFHALQKQDTTCDEIKFEHDLLHEAIYLLDEYKRCYIIRHDIPLEERASNEVVRAITDILPLLNKTMDEDIGRIYSAQEHKKFKEFLKRKHDEAFQKNLEATYKRSKIMNEKIAEAEVQLRRFKDLVKGTKHSETTTTEN